MILQVEELNLPEDKCNEDRNYDFNDCVMKSLSEQVGIRMDKKFFNIPSFFQSQSFLIDPRLGARPSGLYGVGKIWF